MTPIEILTPIILLLAFVGYVTCLSRLFWPSIAATGALGFYLSSSLPFTPENQVFWGGAGVTVIAAILCMWVFALGAQRKERDKKADNWHARQSPKSKRTKKPVKPHKVQSRQGGGRRAQPKPVHTLPDQPEIVIDGTNVMYWDGEPDLRTLRQVVDKLRAKNLLPFVFFDASARHHLGDTSLNAKGFARALGLKQDRVTVCPAQTEADAFILSYAKENRLPVVSNDKFGDRAAQVKGLKLIKGVIANGKPILHGI